MRTVVKKVDEYKVGGEPGNPEIRLAQDWDVYYIVNVADPASVLHDFSQTDACEEVRNIAGFRQDIRFVDWKMFGSPVLLKRNGLYLKDDCGAVVFEFTSYSKETR